MRWSIGSIIPETGADHEIDAIVADKGYHATRVVVLTDALSIRDARALPSAPEDGRSRKPLVEWAGPLFGHRRLAISPSAMQNSTSAMACKLSRRSAAHLKSHRLRRGTSQRGRSLRLWPVRRASPRERGWEFGASQRALSEGMMPLYRWDGRFHCRLQQG
jgi:hypothetical protein